MRFVVDECTGPGVSRWLADQEHDVLSIFDEAQGSSDVQVLKMAVEQDRILVTNDKDFGEMIFRRRLPHCGVVLLRLENERTPFKIAALERLFANYGSSLGGRFVVVAGDKIRIVG